MSLSFNEKQILLTSLTKYESELNYDKDKIQALKNKIKKELSIDDK